MKLEIGLRFYNKQDWDNATCTYALCVMTQVTHEYVYWRRNSKPRARSKKFSLDKANLFILSTVDINGNVHQYQ